MSESSEQRTFTTNHYEFECWWLEKRSARDKEKAEEERGENYPS